MKQNYIFPDLVQIDLSGLVAHYRYHQLPENIITNIIIATMMMIMTTMNMMMIAQSVPGSGDKEEESGLTREEIQEQERLRLVTILTTLTMMILIN